MLETEMRTFEIALPDLLQTRRGQYVLIHHDQVEGVWTTENEAFVEGCKRFGMDPFLVMLIERPEPARAIYQEIVQCPLPTGS